MYHYHVNSFTWYDNYKQQHFREIVTYFRICMNAFKPSAMYIHCMIWHLIS